jgi:hypothetical protein
VPICSIDSTLSDPYYSTSNMDRREYMLLTFFLVGCLCPGWGIPVEKVSLYYGENYIRR